MHQTRQEVITRVPLPRKGTKYVARAASHHREAVPVVIAVRDMLKIAQTAQEVREMIKQKLLKVNGRTVFDLKQSIKLYNILEADKVYRLVISPTGKFALEPSPEKGLRVVKVVNKRLVSNGKIQLNMHDGTNIVTKDPVAVGDSLYIDFDTKIKKHLPLAKAKKVAVIAGKYAGSEGAVDAIEGSKVRITMDGGHAALLNASSVIAL